MARNALRPALRHYAHSAPGVPIRYLLRDEFTTDEAAPLASPRTAEPGPGTLTVVDANNDCSISGGELVQSSDVGAVTVADSTTRDRIAGRAMITSFRRTTSPVERRTYLGWSSGTDATLSTGSGSSSNEVLALASIPTGYMLAQDAQTRYALVLRSAGSFALAGNTLLWVDSVQSGGALTARWTRAANRASIAMTYLRVADLPAPWASDYGIATQRLAGARSNNDAFVHTADCLLEFTATTLANTINFRFRMQDATNYWWIGANANNNLYLYEVVGGTATQRGVAGGVLANGHRIVVIAEGSTIRVYSNNVLRITYSSAANFATATAGVLDSVGTGGAVSDIVAWPRTLTGAAAAALTRASG